jgi:hypothetical protein
VQHFVAYHNADQEGHRFNNGRAIRPGGSGWWFTAKHYRKETILGNRLWGIEGSGSPKRYQLVSTDIITQLIPRKRPAPYEGKGLDVQFRADVALQRTDITGLSWFRRLREEQRSFSYGLNKIKDRKVIAALETMRGKGAAGEAGGHPGGKSGQPAADSQRHKLPIAVARHSPSVAKEIVRELIPTKHLTDVLRAVAHSVRFAHQETPSKWGLRLKRDSIMLKVGFVEVLQLGEGWFHILVESDRISKEVRRKRHLLFNRDARYRHAPGCETCDIDDIPKIASGYSDLLPAHEEAIRIAARSRIHTSTTKDHSPGLITFISQELNMPLFQPAYVELSENRQHSRGLSRGGFRRRRRNSRAGHSV